MPFLPFFFSALSQFWVVCARWVRERRGAVQCAPPPPGGGASTGSGAAPAPSAGTGAGIRDTGQGTNAAGTARLRSPRAETITLLLTADIDCSCPLATPRCIRIASQIKTTFGSYFLRVTNFLSFRV